MSDSRIIYWCETHESTGATFEDSRALRQMLERCRIAPMRLIPLEVSEGMVEAAAAAMYERDPRRRSKGQP